MTVTLGTVLWVTPNCRKRQENQQVYELCNPPEISAIQLEQRTREFWIQSEIIGHLIKQNTTACIVLKMDMKLHRDIF